MGTELRRRFIAFAFLLQPSSRLAQKPIASEEDESTRAEEADDDADDREQALPNGCARRDRCDDRPPSLDERAELQRVGTIHDQREDCSGGENRAVPQPQKEACHGGSDRAGAQFLLPREIRCFRFGHVLQPIFERAQRTRSMIGSANGGIRRQRARLRGDLFGPVALELFDFGVEPPILGCMTRLQEVRLEATDLGLHLPARRPQPGARCVVRLETLLRFGSVDDLLGQGRNLSRNDGALRPSICFD
ncbi:MAG TPA: hypothetical protein VF698_03350, partial [Thermoanaerobaculia bacterium]